MIIDQFVHKLKGLTPPRGSQTSTTNVNRPNIIFGTWVRLPMRGQRQIYVTTSYG